MEHILSMIGLAKKAGRVEIGEEPVGSAVRAKKARVILIAQDAAASSFRRARAFANIGNCLYLTVPADKDDLGRCLGRTSCAMAAVTDIGFADVIVKKLAAIDPEKYSEAAEKMDVKARRAAERKREQAQHEKNVRQGKKRIHAETPAPVPAPAQQAEEKKEKRTTRPYTKRRGMKTVDRDRFAGSRPVKKGKGSDHKKK